MKNIRVLQKSIKEPINIEIGWLKPALNGYDLKFYKNGLWQSIVTPIKAASTTDIGGIKVFKINNSDINIQDTENDPNRYYPIEITKDYFATVNVPWTDTKNTAGATKSDSKLYLIGAIKQTDNPQTYSNSNVYIDNKGYLNQGGFVTNSDVNQMYRVLQFNLNKEDLFSPAGLYFENVYRPLQWNQTEGFTHHVVKYTSLCSPTNSDPEVIPISGPLTIIEVKNHNPKEITLRLVGEPVGQIYNGEASSTHILTTNLYSEVYSPRKVIIYVDKYSSMRLNSINYQVSNQTFTIGNVIYTQYDYSKGLADIENSAYKTAKLLQTNSPYVLELDVFVNTQFAPYTLEIFGTQKYTTL